MFRRQKDRAIGVTGQFSKAWSSNSFSKATNPTPEEINNAIIAALARDFEAVPAQARPLLEQAMRSGNGKGILQLGLTDVDVIDSANATAEEYARDRAAELVGMAYNDDGLLVPNPDAEWAISDTTRDKIRRIVAAAFEKETDISLIVRAIQATLQADEAGIFTESRAGMIASTEVAEAQTAGNYGVWQHSGLELRLISNLSADHEGEDECDDNDGVEVRIGEPFPSGDLHPPYHPRCECSVVITHVAQPEEED